ncbi:hypothetical protein ACFVYA_36800 [Amycolatopsis sp. NPDC058278]|uniref:hypothetical protein n=1 Tax=Amycolatopsis sp. NPDC058278 TaxID=3346417 RepID=UPI0036DC4B26
MRSRTAKIVLAATLTAAGLSVALASPATAEPFYCYVSPSGPQFGAVPSGSSSTPCGTLRPSGFPTP